MVQGQRARPCLGRRAAPPEGPSLTCPSLMSGKWTPCSVLPARFSQEQRRGHDTAPPGSFPHLPTTGGHSRLSRASSIPQPLDSTGHELQVTVLGLNPSSASRDSVTSSRDQPPHTGEGLEAPLRVRRPPRPGWCPRPVTAVTTVQIHLTAQCPENIKAKLSVLQALWRGC